MHVSDPQKNLASALGRIPSGVFILTVSGEAGETGMLASWVQQCSFNPPMITFVVGRNRPIANLLVPGRKVTVNVLEANQTDMIAHFGKGFSLTENAFQGLDVRREPDQGPILVEAHAYLIGQVAHRMPAGDHELFLAEVTGGSLLEEGQPMVHVRKNGFHY